MLAGMLLDDDPGKPGWCPWAVRDLLEDGTHVEYAQGFAPSDAMAVELVKAILDVLQAKRLRGEL